MFVVINYYKILNKIMTELTKSIKAVLYERIKSPLSGSFLLTWIVWNWKIIYATFFISENKLEGTRIDYIINSSDQLHLIWGPIASTIIILTIVPLISYYAYWLSLVFKKMFIDKKNKIEGETLLTSKQSLELRRSLKEDLEKVAIIVTEKEEEVEQLKLEIISIKELESNKNKVLIKENKELANKTKILDKENQDLNKINKILGAEAEPKSPVKIILNSEESEKVSDIERYKFKDLIAEFNNSRIFDVVIKNRDIKKPFKSNMLNTSLRKFFLNQKLIEDVEDGYYLVTKKGKGFFDSLKDE
jgi:hypothetical protein